MGGGEGLLHGGGGDEIKDDAVGEDDDSDEEEAYALGGDGGGGLGGAGGAGRPGAGMKTAEEIEDTKAIESAVDAAEWKLELERVAPQLRVVSAADAKDWQGGNVWRAFLLTPRRVDESATLPPLSVIRIFSLTTTNYLPFTNPSSPKCSRVVRALVNPSTGPSMSLEFQKGRR